MSGDLKPIIDRLVPNVDGESPVRHRTAEVHAVNADGTVNLDFAGTIVHHVSVLEWADPSVGDVVQVLAWKGDMLVLGRTRTSDSPESP